ncbi:MAG TPA: SRPBCC domain-containing protein [Mucilaginibacter sp.]|nr:SRPBCC domain-containing protein [Mucilaginibacter sp.]
MKDFKKYYTIQAPPDEVYLALTNPITIELWTGDDVEMSTEAGSEFSLLGGSIVGKNLEFEEGKKIVQQWYFEGEPKESIVTIKLHLGKNNSTSAELRHTNIPDNVYDEFASGWDEFYFGPLAEFFEGD